MRQKEKNNKKRIKVRRGTDGSIQVDPFSLYQSEGVLKQLQAAMRVAKMLKLKGDMD